MKVRVSYTATVGDDYRRAIRHYHGLSGLAAREEVRSWLELHGSSEDDNLMYDLQQAEEAEVAGATEVD